MLWLAAVALLVLLQFWWLPGDPGTPDDTYSSTIQGKRGFFQTLEQLSKAGLLPPVRREAAKLIPDEPCTLVVLSPDRYPDENEQAELTKFVYNGGSLVFAPNWTSPDCHIRGLSIKTEREWFASEEIAVAPVPVSPANGTSSDGTPPPAEADEPVMQAEAEENPAGSVPRTAAPPLQNPPVQTPPPQKQPRSKQNKNMPVDEGVIRNPLEQTPISPPTPPTEAAEGNDAENLSTDIAELEIESQLIPGTFPWRSHATLVDQGLRPVVLVQTTSGDVQAAAWQYAQGLVLASASSDVFSNRAMLDEAQAELAIRLIEYAHAHHINNSSLHQLSDDPPIVVSEFLNASDAYRGTAVLMSPTLRSGTLQLITIALLAGWFGFHRFGPAKQDMSVQRRSLTESAAAVGNLHFRTGSGNEAVRNYLEYMKTQLQKMFGRSVHLSDTATIAARSGMLPEDVERRVRRATVLGNDHSVNTSQAADAIRGLSEILNRLQGIR